MDSIPAGKVLKRTQLGSAKTFPRCTNACPKCLAAYLCGSAFPENGLAFHQDRDEVGKTLVDWLRGNVNYVRIQHLENLSNRSYN